MTTPAQPMSKSTNDGQLASGLHFALSSVAESLASSVSALLAKRLKAHADASTDGLRQAVKEVKDLVPSLLEVEFTRGLLKDDEGARMQRAMLVHLLTAAELKSIVANPVGTLVANPADDEVLTSEQAAKLLHVSRSHVNTLLDNGRLGEVSKTAGGHRRVSKAAVLAYKAKGKERQSKSLEAMTEASQALGLYDDELEGIPRRSKR